MPSTSGAGVNCFALLSRQNRCWFRTTREPVTAALVSRWLDSFAQGLRRLTVVVLDNAPAHRGKAMKQCLQRWEAQGLYVFYLPAYSPHLNLVETLWRKLKYEWLQPRDYADRETLCYGVWQALAAVGKTLKIGFAAPKLNAT